MKKKYFIGILIIIILAIVLASQSNKDSTPIEHEVDGSTNIPPDTSEKNYCTEDSRGIQACNLMYAPVCGWFNQDIKCLKYPCAQEYSNGCFACTDKNVEYWTYGECPESP